mgnify:FL=1
MRDRVFFRMTKNSPHTMSVPGFDGTEPANPRILMSTREAGAMTYIPNYGNPRRNVWLSENGIDPQDCQALTLEHGKTIHCIDKPVQRPLELTGDGIMLSPGSGLHSCAVTVADCMPIFIIDKQLGTITVLHSGFKGTGILDKALEILILTYGCNPKNLHVVLGPHIQACCYDIDRVRAESFSLEFGSESVLQRNGKFFADLRAANIAIAEKFGIGAIFASNQCTSCNAEFGSFRREGAEHFTRMLAVIEFPAQRSNQ